MQVDNVGLKSEPREPPRPWNADVAAAPGEGADGYCLGFDVPYDTWHAGTC